MSKYCVYCGTEISDDAKFCSQCGKEQKKESEINQKKQEEITIAEKDNLIESLDKAKNYFQQKQSTYDEYDDLLKKKSEIIKLSGGGLFIFGVILTAIYFFLFIAPSEYSAETANSVIAKFITISIILIIVLPIVLYNRNNRSFDKQTKSINQQLYNIEKDLLKHFDDFHNSPVSFKYSNPKIIEVLKDIISSGRADTVKESINCMLDDLHKQNMLKKQDDLSKNAKKAADSAEAAALFSAGLFFKNKK
jgi:hypothetical protein